MAETLGSLVDKLTIKTIREFHIRGIFKSKKGKSSQHKLKEKLKILTRQKKLLLKEMEEFILRAWEKGVSLRDQKLKLYNRPHNANRIGNIRSISEAINQLSKKNLELWYLEDEARSKDATLSYIGKIKKKIDLANQARNDLIDKIDELFEKRVVLSKRK